MQDINLYHLLKFYTKKWFVIVLFTVVGVMAGFVYNAYIQVPLYKSDATLLLVSTEDRKIGQDSTLINNYIELLKSRRVLEPALVKQNHAMSYDELASATTATNEKNTEVIKLSIASKNSQMSKDLADSVVISFKDEVKKLYKLDNISIVDNASQSNTPYNVHTAILMSLTTAVGFFASIVLLFFVYDFGVMRQRTVSAVSYKTVENEKSKDIENIEDTSSHKDNFVSKVVTMIIGNDLESAQQHQNSPQRTILAIPDRTKSTPKSNE